MARKPDNVLYKIESVKKLLEPLVQGKSDAEIKMLIRHCVYFKNGRRKQLKENERELHDLLLKHKLSPKTIYEYFLILDAPEHIKQQLKDRKISLREAQSRSYAYKRMIGTQNGKEIMAEMLAIIRRLEWRGQNNIMQQI